MSWWKKVSDHFVSGDTSPNRRDPTAETNALPTPPAVQRSSSHVEALSILHNAATVDEAGDSTRALALYERGVEQLLNAIKDESNEERKQTLRAQAAAVLERAEVLKLVNKAGAAAEQRRVTAPPKPVAPLPLRRAPAPVSPLPPRGGRGAGRGANPARPASGGRASGRGGSSQDEGGSSSLVSDLEKTAIQTEKPNVRWDDVAGLEQAKAALQEAVVLPLRFPSLFTGERKPWKGILLYGPPGTGKSHLAKAVATEVDATFFAVSSSDMVSKWVGESEKLVRALFESATKRKPSVVFIDEVDALCSNRSDGESDASRRLKNELLVRMSAADDGVLVLGATNIPWNLDPAVRRRFERRIYIPLPDEIARRALLGIHLGSTPHTLHEGDLVAVARRTDGLSGADMSVLVRDALMQPVRELQAATHFARDAAGNYYPVAAGTRGGKQMALLDVPASALRVPVVTLDHFQSVISKVRPTVGPEDLKQHTQFTKDFGSG